MTRTRAIVVAIVALLAIGGVGIWIAYDQVLSGDAIPALTLPSGAPFGLRRRRRGNRGPRRLRRSRRDGGRDRRRTRWPRDRREPRRRLGDRHRCQHGGLPRPRAPRAALRRQRRRRPVHDGGHRHGHPHRVGRQRPGDGRDHRRRHHDDRVRPQPARQPDAQRGPPDRQLPDRVLHAHRAGRRPGRGPDRRRRRRDPPRRPDAPRRDQDASTSRPRRSSSNGQIQIQGSITFPLGDYSITAPNIGGFIVSIADEGTLEFLVTFAK